MYTEIYMEDHARSKLSNFRRQAEVERWYRNLDEHNRLQEEPVSMPNWTSISQVFLTLFGQGSTITQAN